MDISVSVILAIQVLIVIQVITIVTYIVVNSTKNTYMSRFVSVGDALGRERPMTLMSSYFVGHSGCAVT